MKIVDRLYKEVTFHRAWKDEYKIPACCVFLEERDSVLITLENTIPRMSIKRESMCCGR